MDKAAKRRGRPATATMAPSTFLNRYQQEGEFPIGQGTYGVVYKARDLVRFAFAHPPGRRTGCGRHTDRSGRVVTAAVVVISIRRSRDAPWR